MTTSAITRARLHALLDDPPARLCIIQAASGCGKTTLARTWVQASCDDSNLWISLATEVESTHAFWGRVIQIAGRSGLIDATAATAVVADINASENPIDPVSDLFNALPPLVVALDAYEAIGEITLAVDAGILELIRRVPDLRMVVTTRGGTSLSDPIQELRGNSFVIREDLLRFTEDDTMRLFEAHGVAPDTDVITGLVRDTRGYALAVRAALLTLTHQTSSLGGTHHWQSLITQDIRSQIRDPALNEFIVDTCVPLYFDADLATCLTGNPDTHALIQALERDGLGRWIPWEADRDVFQYVEAIRDAFLRSVRTTEPQRYQAAAAESAAWHHAHGDHDAALDLALDAERYDIAEDVVRDYLIEHPETYTTDRLVRQLQQVPRISLQAHPTLALGLGLALLTNPALRASAPLYLQIASEYAMTSAIDPSDAEAFWRSSYQATTRRLLGHFHEAAELVPQALTYLDRLTPSERDGIAEVIPIALRNHAYTQFQAGEVDAACATIGRAAAETPNKWARNYTLSFAAGIQALTGHQAEAESALAMMDPQAWPRDHERTYMNGLGRIAQAVLCLDDFRPKDALEHFADNESWRDTSEFWAYLNWATANSHLLLGEAAAEAHRIEAALQATPRPLGIGRNLGTVALRGVLAILWMSTGDYPRASALLQSEDSHSGQVMPARLLHLHLLGRSDEALHLAHLIAETPEHTVRSTAASLTIAAASALRENTEATARTLLERAASLYANHGRRLHLAYLPEEDLAALRALAERSVGALASTYLSGSVSSWATPHEAPETLSAREAVVLGMLIRRQSRTEIATALHVSENTVKSQITSVYRKLGVATRAQAVERAASLGLL